MKERAHKASLMLEPEAEWARDHVRDLMQLVKLQLTGSLFSALFPDFEARFSSRSSRLGGNITFGAEFSARRWLLSFNTDTIRTSSTCEPNLPFFCDGSPYLLSTLHTVLLFRTHVRKITHYWGAGIF